MGVKLPDGLQADEIRILQEFRRLGKRELTGGEIGAIRHPVGGGEAAVRGLLEKGFLAGEGEDRFALTPKSDEILAVDYTPYSERG